MDMGLRADYGATDIGTLGAWVESVEENSPAHRAGITYGMRIDAVNGVTLTDLITWRWETDGSHVVLDVFDPTYNTTAQVELTRAYNEDWGIEFNDVVFDGIKTCVNACMFCFMSMLPKDMRPSLSLRDDDYRLSFLQGNFVTLTNVDDFDCARIIDCALSPMNVSLHAISDDVRRKLIGPHAKRGIEVLEQLMDAGIEIHGQIVLCPGINDGEELEKTLTWVESHPQITSLALVPVGYTRFSRKFTSSYSDNRDAARAVINTVKSYQERSRKRDGITRFQLSDEFYVAAELEVPSSESYDDFPQYYDGIGMLRAFMDEAAFVCSTRKTELTCCIEKLNELKSHVILVCGEAAQTTIQAFCDLWAPSKEIASYAIKNNFFGGDVNVTGLIVAQDLFEQLPKDLTNTVVVIPDVMLNFDRITLDGVNEQALINEIKARGGIYCCSIPNPSDLLDTLYKQLGCKK